MPLLSKKKPPASPAVQTAPSLVLPIGSLGNIRTEQRKFGVQFGVAPKDSEELQRVLAAPQRPIPSPDVLDGYVEKWTRELELHPGETCNCPIKRLNRPQAWALEEASWGLTGVLGSLKIGSGKTGLDILYAMVVPGVKLAALLIQPNLRAQFAADFATWALHFKVPNWIRSGHSGVYYQGRPVLHVLAYSELSNASATTWFQAYKPQLVIADEVQNLQDRKSVRTHRVLRRFADAPETVFLAHSGSLTTRSVRQYAHTAALSLRMNSPLPIEPSTTEEWAPLLDPEPPNGLRPAAGALRKLCLEDETPQEAFLRRATNTPGFITTEDSRLPTSVTIRVRKPGRLPPDVASALAVVRNKKRRPDGEELIEMSDIAACAKQVATGLYMRWKFPRGEPEDLIEDWFAKRKAFGAELRDRLLRRVEHMDSPKLCKEAAERFHAGYEGKMPVWPSECWPAWRDVKGLVRPESDTVWIDDFLVRDAAAWAREAPGIVWCDHPAFGHKLAKMAGIEYYGAGEQASAGILKCDGGHSIVASIKAQGTGKNLQAFNRALIVDMPSDAGIVEQVIGRMYRQGQKRDVEIFRYEHTEEFENSWLSVIRNAAYVRATTGAVHVVLFALDG